MLGPRIPLARATWLVAATLLGATTIAAADSAAADIEGLELRSGALDAATAQPEEVCADSATTRRPQSSYLQIASEAHHHHYFTPDGKATSALHRRVTASMPLAGFGGEVVRTKAASEGSEGGVSLAAHVGSDGRVVGMDRAAGDGLALLGGQGAASARRLATSMPASVGDSASLHASLVDDIIELASSRASLYLLAGNSAVAAESRRVEAPIASMLVVLSVLALLVCVVGCGIMILGGSTTRQEVSKGYETPEYGHKRGAETWNPFSGDLTMPLHGDSGQERYSPAPSARGTSPMPPGGSEAGGRPSTAPVLPPTDTRVPSRSPVGARPSVHTTPNLPQHAAEYGRGAEHGGSLPPGSRSTGTGMPKAMHLCPGLVVPGGNECVLTVPTLKTVGVPPRNAVSFYIRDLNGQPVIIADVMVQPWRATGSGGGVGESPIVVLREAAQRDKPQGSGADMPHDTPMLAYVKASLEGADRRSAYVYDRRNQIFGHISKDQSHNCYRFTSSRAGIQVAFAGDFARHEVSATSERGQKMADVQLHNPVFDPAAEHSMLRVFQNTDAGMIICVLLCIDHMELAD